MSGVIHDAEPFRGAEGALDCSFKPNQPHPLDLTGV